MFTHTCVNQNGPAPPNSSPEYAVLILTTRNPNPRYGLGFKVDQPLSREP